MYKALSFLMETVRVSSSLLFYVTDSTMPSFARLLALVALSLAAAASPATVGEYSMLRRECPLF